MSTSRVRSRSPTPIRTLPVFPGRRLTPPDGTASSCPLSNRTSTRELNAIRLRQEKSLGRELERIDEYFENYARELGERSRRSGSEGVKLKTADRLAAAKAEHGRRRADQIARHEIRIHPHLDGLLLVGEPAWRADLAVERGRASENIFPVFVPRSRRWHL